MKDQGCIFEPGSPACLGYHKQDTVELFHGNTQARRIAALEGTVREARMLVERMTQGSMPADVARLTTIFREALREPYRSTEEAIAGELAFKQRFQAGGEPEEVGQPCVNCGYCALHGSMRSCACPRRDDEE